MAQVSITSTDSFAARAQRSEARRVILWMAVLGGMMCITLTRRIAGGVTMSDNRAFIPYMSALIAGMIYQVALLWKLKLANRAGVLLPRWLPRVSAMADMGVAIALLLVVAFFSPRGAVPALSGPALLLTPLVVLMSVLQLRPKLTLWMGLAGATVHVLLAIRAIALTNAPIEAWALYFAYGGILILTAVAGMLVSREIKGHVREAADEAVGRERSERQVSGMRHDLNVARDIQQGLLPRSAPSLAGFDIVGMNRPADQTGGDYWDWQELPDGRLAVVLADVAGHGIGPALVMAVCRAYARSTAHSIPDPAALVTRVNQLLENDLPADRFITFVLSVFDPDGSVQMISAGHGPTLWYQAATKKVTQFGGDGYPLGVLPGETYGPTQTLKLEIGDILFFLTDGFFEWSRPGDDEAYGTERLEKVLIEVANGDAKTILKSMDDAVCKFCAGSPQNDDMTAVVIKRTVA